MRRPFPITLIQRCPPGVLELRLDFCDPLSRREEAGWKDVLKTFVDAANCGVLAGPGIAPADSGCMVERVAFTGRNAHLLLRKTAVDASAYTVLLNLCHWGHVNISRLQQFELRWEHCPESTNAALVTFPMAWPHLSFSLQQYELVGQTIAIDIEFYQPQPAGKREEINELIGCWFKAANWGGYADDHFPPPTSTVIIASEPMTTDVLSISWYIEAYHCSDQVFDGVINCLERISVTQAPIRQVTIGE